MSRLMKIDVVVAMMLSVLLLGGVLLATGWYALFHGYFDHGLFEIKQTEWSSSRPQRVAVVAERSDYEAMSSNQYFVLILDHIPSATELRHTYHSHDVIFRAADDCLSVRWTDPRSLTITCTMTVSRPTLQPGHRSTKTQSRGCHHKIRKYRRYRGQAMRVSTICWQGQKRSRPATLAQWWSQSATLEQRVRLHI